MVEHTQDQPAAWLLESIDYQHNNRTIDLCNKHSITVYRIPPNTTGWLQPCDSIVWSTDLWTNRCEQVTTRVTTAQLYTHRISLDSLSAELS